LCNWHGEGHNSQGDLDSGVVMEVGKVSYMGGSAFVFVPKNMIAVALLFEWYALCKINGTYTVCIYSCVHLLISQKLNILIEGLILIYIWGFRDSNINPETNQLSWYIFL
jgi:hypothetical protein